eukprot:7785795-Prorocentrum_lima.AAC.1
MTSSLVGSEMCIRDSGCGPRRRPGMQARVSGAGRGAAGVAAAAVSYTHLTLPTSVDLGGR